MLSFIHLSDIHFRTFSGDPFDIDEDLRSELIYDISHNLTKIPSIEEISFVKYDVGVKNVYMLL